MRIKRTIDDCAGKFIWQHRMKLCSSAPTHDLVRLSVEKVFFRTGGDARPSLLLVSMLECGNPILDSVK